MTDQKPGPESGHGPNCNCVRAQMEAELPAEKSGPEPSEEDFKVAEEVLARVADATGRGWKIRQVALAMAHEREKAAKAVCVHCREGAPFVRKGVHGVRHKGRKACEHSCGAAAIRSGGRE